RETVIEPHRVPDDLDRIPVALVPRRNRHKRPILAAPHQVNNLTMPSGPTPPARWWNESSRGPPPAVGGGSSCATSASTRTTHGCEPVAPHSISAPSSIAVLPAGTERGPWPDRRGPHFLACCGTRTSRPH